MRNATIQKQPAHPHPVVHADDARHLVSAEGPLGESFQAVQPTEVETFLLAMAEHFNLRSRLDLSFTATSDGAGLRSNWSVPHDPQGYSGDTDRIGRRLFAEIEALAVVDEEEASWAIMAAINDPAWNHTAQGCGWGIESGFSRRLAELAITGMRAVRAGWALPEAGDLKGPSPAQEEKLA